MVLAATACVLQARRDDVYSADRHARGRLHARDAQFEGRATRRGRLTRYGKLVARSTIRGRKLTLTPAPRGTAARLKGRHGLKVPPARPSGVRIR